MISKKKFAAVAFGILGAISGGAEAASAGYDGRVPVTDYRGDWTSAHQYFKGQVVLYNNQAWIALRNKINNASKANPPSDQNNDWALFAAGTTTQVINTSGSGASSGGLQASDGGDRLLGSVVAASSRSLTVWQTDLQVYARLEVNPHDRTTLIPTMWGTDNYVYTSSDCSGTALRVFSETGDGSVVPNDLTGYSLFGNLSYAEAQVEPGGDRTPTGKYVMLGNLLSKISNPGLSEVTVSNDVTTVGSVKVGFQCVEWDPNDQRCKAYSDAKEKQCLALNVTNSPIAPRLDITPGAYSAALKSTYWVYNGKFDYPSYDAAYSAYLADQFAYLSNRIAWHYYAQYNIIPPNSVRWVYTYADGVAPFPFNVTQPVTVK